MNANRMRTSLFLAALLLAGAGLLKYAQHLGVIEPDFAERATGVMIGLMLAYYGNVIPKAVGTSRNLEAGARRQSALRVSGWAFALAGLAYAALSPIAPKGMGDSISIAAVALAVIVTLGYAVWIGATCARNDAANVHPGEPS